LDLETENGVEKREKRRDWRENIFERRERNFLLNAYRNNYTWSRIYTTHTMPAKTNWIVTEI
jgi:hypothetical protein